MRQARFATAVAVALTAFAPVGHAVVITVQDPGFEDRDIADGTYSNFNAGDAWTILPSGFAGAGPIDGVNGNFPGLDAFEGEQFGASINAGFGQTLSAVFDPDSSYRIDFRVAPSSNIAADGFYAYEVTLATTERVLKSTTVAFTDVSPTWLSDSLVFDPQVDPFQPQAEGETLRIAFFGVHPRSIDDSVAFDDIRVSSTPLQNGVPLPTPGTAVLAAAGLLLVAARSRWATRDSS